MGMMIEKMYGSYSDADLNDWERFPMNASVLTSSAFGAWLLRRDERRDTSIQADYEARLKADLEAILTELQLEIEELEIDVPFGFEPVSKTSAFYEGVSASSKVIQQKINALKGNE